RPFRIGFCKRIHCSLHEQLTGPERTLDRAAHALHATWPYMSFVELLPPPLRDDFLRGRWLPVVGAGYSRNARLPHGRSMPDWGGLGNLLARELQGYEPQNAVDAISAYAEEYGRSRFVERLSEELYIGVGQLGNAYLALCRAGFDLILTT